ncbi:MAG: gamma-glutamyltransferase family protein [Alphaproteobacteria bacterium]|nr:gamma-glutamyltransferase family protein [Alphaproteobacteria bacterium]
MFTTRPEILGTFGVVASTHWLATATGMAILEKGGNAFDAAVAMGFALQVVEPHLNGPGGDMPLLLWSQSERRLRVVCGQGPAPGAATIARYRDMGLDIVPGTGLLAACVPGAFDAWLLMLRDYGTLTPAEVMAPAIAFAGNGYPLVSHICNTIEGVRELFLTEWRSSAAVYLPGGATPKAGSIFRNLKLAETYRRIVGEAEAAGADRVRQVEAARRAFLEGFVAEAIDRFCRTEAVMDTSGERHRGLITGDDMGRWRASYDEPITYDYHGYTLAKAGPWAQSPVFLQQLALLRDFDIAGMDPFGADFVHTVVEAGKLAYADREAYYGDPDFVDVPMATLLSDTYNAERRGLIGERASLELRPGRIAGHDARIGQTRGPVRQAAGAGEPTMARTGTVAGDTCHLDVIDRHGNMVSATPSGGWLQSSPVIPELGFCLGSRAQMFWLEEGLPGSLAPGKRPRTTLSPSFAFRDGKPYMPFGTPGGDGQDQWQIVFFLRHAQHGMNLQEAIDAPTFQSSHFPSSFYPRQAEPGRLTVEGRMAAETVMELRRRGHRVDIGGDWSQGRLSACTKDGDVLKAAANPRLMQGYAAGR